MKKSFLLSAALITFSTSALAVPPEAKIFMTCVTEMPTTSIDAVQEGDVVNMNVYHHNGPEYAPITNSLLTPTDIPGLQSKANMILKLGNHWKFQWSRSGCNADAPGFFQCIGEAKDFEVNGITVHPVAFTTSEVLQKTMWGTYAHKTLQLDVRVEEKEYRIVMNYAPGECFGAGPAREKALQRALRLK